ncbi:protein grindelwald-like [Teleopsis dalmanni]|uniref:protein grindelwald-like n=1 Tax=Teleopsis dalmanni TaxID=139649 RepID=UPI0018CE7995|nr:protein grindelwald-like [Teleopsis dalmanni]
MDHNKSEFNQYEPLKAEIHSIQARLNLTLVLLIVLLALIAIRYAYKGIRWLRHKPCVSIVLKKLQPNKFVTNHTHNGKDLGGTTIQNVMTINEIENAPSQIYSVTGAEGSILTVTTPVSTRYPAENSSTPTSVPTAEYSYDNQALAVTPVSEKPSGTQGF